MKNNRYVIGLILAMGLAGTVEAGTETGDKARPAKSKQGATVESKQQALNDDKEWNAWSQRCEVAFSALNGNLWKNPKTGSVIDMQLNIVRQNMIGKIISKKFIPYIEFSGNWLLTTTEGIKTKTDIEGTLHCSEYGERVLLTMIFPEGHPCVGDVHYYMGVLNAGNRLPLEPVKYDKSIVQSCSDQRDDWVIYPFKAK